jgi:TIR domain
MRADVDLSGVRGLASCVHGGPSSVDHRTLAKSGALPLSFLQGVGFSDAVIQAIPSLYSKATQFYSCFISYSTMDQEFSGLIYSDLQNRGVRCWMAPHDMPVGGKVLDEIHAAIRLRDKLFLILSENSIASEWVEDEVTRAFDEERKRGRTVLFPIRLDDAVLKSNEAWVEKLRARHIADFTNWKDHDRYKKSFDRILRDLKVQQAVGSSP